LNTLALKVTASFGALPAGQYQAITVLSLIPKPTNLPADPFHTI
jgi:hypothetical protein